MHFNSNNSFLSLVKYPISPFGEAANQNRDCCITKPVSRTRTKCLNFSLITSISSSRSLYRNFFPWFNAALTLAGRSLKSQGLIISVHKVSKFLWRMKILWRILEVLWGLRNSNCKEHSLCFLVSFSIFTQFWKIIWVNWEKFPHYCLQYRYNSKSLYYYGMLGFQEILFHHHWWRVNHPLVQDFPKTQKFHQIIVSGLPGWPNLKVAIMCLIV